MEQAINHIKKYIHTYTHTYVHTYIHTHIHTYTHTYIHTHIHTYIHTYILRTYVSAYYRTSVHRYFDVLEVLDSEDIIFQDNCIHIYRCHITNNKTSPTPLSEHQICDCSSFFGHTRFSCEPISVLLDHSNAVQVASSYAR